MRRALLNLEGVLDADVSYKNKRADVRYRSDLVQPRAMTVAIEDAGFEASVMENEDAGP